MLVTAVPSFAAGRSTAVGVLANTGTAGSTWPAISADGRYAAFCATDQFIQRIFLYDRYSQAVSNLTPLANGPSVSPAVSANGRYLAFRSSATNLDGTDANGTVTDIFLRDGVTGTITLVSRATDGTQGNNASYFAVPSDDGRYVAFSSTATNLVAGDANGGIADLFLKDLATGTTTLVDVSGAGVQADRGVGSITNFSMSPNGRYVVFPSGSALTADDVSGSADIFLRDTKSGTTTLISRVVRSSGFDGDGRYPSISADGRYIAFQSGSSRLVATDTDNFYSDIYLHDRTTGTTIKVTENANESSVIPSISADGRYVTYTSRASNLVADDTNGAIDTFRYDVRTGTTIRLNVTPQGQQSTGDGTAFANFPAPLSASGRFIAFASVANDLSAADTNGTGDAFVRDVQLKASQSANVRMTLAAPPTATKNVAFTYTATVANAGPDAADLTSATFSLPPALTIASVTASQGTCNRNGLMVCRLGTIASGGSVTVQIDVKPIVKGSIHVSGTAESIARDAKMGNNAAEVDVTVN